MVDNISEEHRSWNMSRIRSKDTKPELILRSLLHRAGFRFSLQRKDLPGKPDIILKKYKTVIFIHGCYWHRHPNCKNATTPSTRQEWWQNKFQQNIKRDKLNKSALQEKGWNVISV